MADWFKFYETDLDDELLQWAMTEQPCTSVVYFALLSKCCKEKNDSFAWSTDCALLAMANKVHFGVGLVNDAISLLQRIGMVSVSGGILTVKNWKSRQSEYCQRKSSKPVPTVSRHSPDNVALEERIGEEIKRGEKTRKVGNGKNLSGENVYMATGDMPHEYQ